MDQLESPLLVSDIVDVGAFLSLISSGRPGSTIASRWSNCFTSILPLFAQLGRFGSFAFRKFGALAGCIFRSSKFSSVCILYCDWVVSGFLSFVLGVFARFGSLRYLFSIDRMGSIPRVLSSISFVIGSILRRTLKMSAGPPPPPTTASY